MIPIGDDRRLPVFPIAVYAIIALNVYVFFQEASAANPEQFTAAFGVIPYDITHGVQPPPPSPRPEWLTLVTSTFLHGSILHIFFNMLFLFVFGPDVEYLTGHLRFIAFYLLAGVVGSLAQVVMGPGSMVPVIGASGAIAGVLGAYIVNFPTHSIRAIVPIGCFPLFLRLPAIVFIGFWALTQFLHGFGTVAPNVNTEQGGGIAYFSHIGGFVTGVLLIGLFRIRSGTDRRYRYYY